MRFNGSVSKARRALPTAMARGLSGLAVVGLVACSAPQGQFMDVSFGGKVPGAVAREAYDGTLAVRIRLPERTTQAVPGNWASIKVTLANATKLTTAITKTVNQGAGSTVTSVFTGLRTGSGYSVSVELYDAQDAGGTKLKTGATTGITLVAGNNDVTITLVDPGSITGAVSDAVPSTISLDGSPFNLSAPAGVVVDSDGNLFFADTSCRILKKNSSNGTYSVLAGSGVCATSTECTETAASGDGGATTCDGTGTAAKLSGPQNMTIDSSNNIYFMDAGAKCLVRRSTPGGTVETILGGGGCGYSNATNYGGKFSNPQGVVFDTGNSFLYVGDTGNHKLRKVSPSSGQASDVTGGSAGYQDSATNGAQVRLNSPKGVVLDSASNATHIFVADSANNVIRKVKIADGTSSTLAGSTAGTSGFTDSTTAGSVRFSGPSGITLGADGFLYVADTGNHAVRKVNASTGETTTVAGNGSAGCAEGSGTGSALLTSPTQVFRAADGKLYIANTGCNKVSVVQ